MKNFGIVCAALVVIASMSASASAADHVSKSTLSSMGLGSMQLLSDNDGLAIRGMGTYASVWGQSTANARGGQTSTNGYEAGADHRHSPSSARGSNLSYAGKVSAVVNNNGFEIKARVNVGGGFSSASAH